MVKNVTRDYVKKLVRGLKKDIRKEDFSKYNQFELYYLSYNDFKWYSKYNKRVPSVPIKVGIRMMSAYVEDKDGNFKRRPLGKLDELFYRKINSVDVDRVFDLNLGFTEDNMSIYNSKMEYLEIRIGNDEKGVRILEGYYRIPENENMVKPGNPEYKNIDGKGMEDKFKEFLRQNRFRVKEVKLKSNNKEFRVWVDESNLEYWREMVKVIREFDRELSKGV